MPEWAEKQGFADNADAVAGATLFAESGCLNCHTYLGAGGQNLGAPDLSEEGAKGRGIQWQIDHLTNPSSKTPGSPMPSFAALGEDNLKLLATFLEASKGEQKWSDRREARLSAGHRGSGRLGSDVMRVFLGVTGASGAPYAARLLQSLAAAGCEIGLVASAAGIEVLATELYGDPALPRDEVLERFVGDAGEPGHGVRDRRLLEPVCERLGEGRRLRRLSLLDEHRRHARRPGRWRTSSTAPPRSR